MHKSYEVGSTTQYLKFSKLLQQEDVVLALQFLMAANDIQTAHYVNKSLGEVDDKNLAEFIQGSRFYQVRLICAQVREGLRLVEAAQSSKTIKKMIESDNSAIDAFARLSEISPTGKRKTDFELMDRIRNKGVFHYYEWRDHQREMPDWIMGVLTMLGNNNKIGSVVWQRDSFKPVRFSFIDDIVNWVFHINILGLDANSTDVWNDAKDVSELLIGIVDDFFTVALVIARELQLNCYS